MLGRERGVRAYYFVVDDMNWNCLAALMWSSACMLRVQYSTSIAGAVT